MAQTRRSSMARSLIVSGLLAGALVTLLWAAPAVPPVRTAGDFQRWLVVTGPDQVLVTLAAVGSWLCLAWLTAGALLVTLGRLPGWGGALCAVVGARLTPAILRRAVEGVLGTALIGSSLALPLAASAAGPPAAVPAAASGQSQDGWPDLDRPARTPGSPPAAAGTPAPGTAAPGPGGNRAGKTQPSPNVVVRSGDTLWGIARRALGDAATPAAVAASWPRWHTANRHVIGPDPDLLRPGQRLAPPPVRQRR